MDGQAADILIEAAHAVSETREVTEGHRTGKGRTMEIPFLGDPEEIDLIQLGDWRLRWAGYAKIALIGDEILDTPSRQALFRSE